MRLSGVHYKHHPPSSYPPHTQDAPLSLPFCCVCGCLCLPPLLLAGAASYPSVLFLLCAVAGCCSCIVVLPVVRCLSKAVQPFPQRGRRPVHLLYPRSLHQRVLYPGHGTNACHCYGHEPHRLPRHPQLAARPRAAHRKITSEALALAREYAVPCGVRRLVLCHPLNPIRLTLSLMPFWYASDPDKLVRPQQFDRALCP